MIGLTEIGAIGIIVLVILALLIPFILVVIVGIGFANLLGLTWWEFIILFYLVISGILTMIGK